MEKWKSLSKLTLQGIAMAIMLMDHIGIALLPNLFLRCIGRLAFPIFAYFIAEGFARTHSVKNYLFRMAAFALLTEPFFDLMHTGKLWMPFYQNVLWTFCIALLCLWGLDILRQRHEGSLLWALDMVLVCLAGFAAGELLDTDYGGIGVLLVIGFYFSRKCKNRPLVELCALTVFCLYLRGDEFFALLAWPLLQLYNGTPGKQSKPIQYACYAFYPVHLLILGLIARIPH